MVNSITTLLFGAKYQRTRFHAAFALYLLIVVIGSVPHARAEIGSLASGLVLHSLAYSVITFLLFTGFAAGGQKNAIRACIIVAVMGAFDEYVQSYFPYRNAALSDWLVDCGASIVTVLLLTMMAPRLRLRGGD